MPKNHVMVNLGSKSDAVMANFFLTLLREFGVRYRVAVASCHWSAGKAFSDHIDKIEENFIIGIGGMSFAAAGLIAALDRNAHRMGRITFAVPLDKAAQSAIEDLPPGTAVITCGFNRTDVKASITNAAIAVANIIARDDPTVAEKLGQWYTRQSAKKGILPHVTLDENNLIPIEEKKS